MRFGFAKIALAAVIFSLGGTLSATAQDAQSICRSLAGEDFSKIPDAPTQLIRTAWVNATPDLPAYCHAEGYIATHVGFEMRIPLSNWNGKLLMQGCGGYCGSSAVIALCSDAVNRGYACVATDLGHKGTPLDALWAYNNPQAEIDFYYRATHVTAQAAKAILERVVGRAPERNYFRGCSTGGRQGLVSAQRFPADFDGIIAAAPAGVSPGGGLHLIWSALANLDNQGQSIMAPEKLPLLHNAVVKACDAIDGLEDGLIDDPRKCSFDPAELQCRRRPGNDCLTGPEVAVVRKIYQGAINSSGEPLYRAVPMPGSELEWAPAYIGIDGKPSVYYLFGGDFFRYLAFADDPGPTWKPEHFDMDRDPQRMGYNRHLNNAADPDMRAFKARGGKLISYQGWSDQSVPPLGIIDYREDVMRFMGGAENVDDFFRLFMLPGVAHCYGGEGADRIDALRALEAWVEEGRAPGQLTAYKLARDPGGFASVSFPIPPADVAFSRPVYPYPSVARYTGEGDAEDAKNFEAIDPTE